MNAALIALAAAGACYAIAVLAPVLAGRRAAARELAPLPPYTVPLSHRPLRDPPRVGRARPTRAPPRDQLLRHGGRVRHRTDPRKSDRRTPRRGRALDEGGAAVTTGERDSTDTAAEVGRVVVARAADRDDRRLPPARRASGRIRRLHRKAPSRARAIARRGQDSLSRVVRAVH